jgi:hypothetical protein
MAQPEVLDDKRPKIKVNEVVLFVDLDSRP